MRWVVRIGFFALICVGVGPTSYGQFFNQRFVAPIDSQITPEIDRSVEQSIENATQLIKQKQFQPAVERLQSVLDHAEDFFLEKDFQTRSTPDTGVRAQVLRILSAMPTEGRNVYESEFGPRARNLLKQALASSDFPALSQLIARYQMTAAGFEAMQTLAARAMDREQPLQAALLSEAMLLHPRGNGPLKGALLLQTAYAWHLAGQTEKSLAALEALSGESGPWKIGEQPIVPAPDIRNTPEWLGAHFGPPVIPPLETVTAWAMPRGGETGNESATAACPVGGGLWSISTRENLRFLPDLVANTERIKGLGDLVRQIERSMRDNNRLLQPAGVPLVIGDVVVYRTINDVSAVSLKSGQLLWRSATTDGMMAWLFQSPQAVNGNIATSSLLTFRGYLRFKLFRDQLSGSLTSDGKSIYAVEEAESQFSPLLPRNRMPFGAPMISDPANKLVAYDVSGGRLLWEIGGPSGTPPAELSNIFFLGPPLPHEGRLYCLAEAKSEIRLVSLIPDEKSPRLEWSQSLVMADRGVFIAPRRLAGLIPAVSDGLAICPTANGSVVAFDLVQRQLRWGYSYDSTTRRLHQGADVPNDEEEGRWLDSNPILVDGHAILTPRDSSELHCINMADGSLKWKRSREQGLYVAAVIDGRIIVVGKSQIVAYALGDGSEVWKERTEIPEPAGRGVRIQAQYLLPLSTGEIATLDLSSGQILGRSKLPDGRLPGNLAVGAGALVSCSVNDVVGFRQLADIEKQVVEQLAANSLDPEALALRGELKLHRGQESEAIDDLRLSLKQSPTSQVKRILAETLLNRLRNDPKELMKSAAELDDLTEDPRQRVEFRRLYASALNDIGDRVGAVSQLIRLAMGSSILDEMITVEPGRAISLEQHTRSQLFLVYDNADPDQKSAIRQTFAKEKEAALLAPDARQRLARFVKLLIGHPAAERDLLGLVEPKNALSSELSRVRLLERLTQSQERSIAATATAALAANYLALNATHEALPWIEELKSRFPQEVCRAGKTGRQLSDEWLMRADLKSMEPLPVWTAGAIDFRRSDDSTVQVTFPVEIATRVGPYFRDWTFETDSMVTILTARDPSTRVVWTMPLTNLPDDVRGQSSQLHIRGRRLALSSGPWLRVMEATNLQDPPKVLFDQSLRPNASLTSRRLDNRTERRLLANGKHFLMNPDARGTPGFLLGLTDEAVCYQVDNRLFAADPITGDVLWSWTASLFTKVEGTVDKYVVVNTSTNGAMILHTLDGSVREKVSGNPQDVALWFRGTRRLSHRAPTPDQRLFELRDFDGDQVVWQSQHPAGTLHCIVEDEEVALLEPGGNLVILNLATGEKITQADLPIKRPLKSDGHMAVHRWEDHYFVIAGVAPRITDQRRVMPLNSGPPREFGLPAGFGVSTPTSFTLDGFVSSISRKDGKIQWSIPVTELAYDAAQPTNLPVLVLASMQSETDKLSGVPVSPRMAVLVLNKRSGHKIYEKREPITSIGRGVQFAPQIDEQKLIIDFYNWQLNLTIRPEK